MVLRATPGASRSRSPVPSRSSPASSTGPPIGIGRSEQPMVARSSAYYSPVAAASTWRPVSGPLSCANREHIPRETACLKSRADPRLLPKLCLIGPVRLTRTLLGPSHSRSSAPIQPRKSHLGNARSATCGNGSALQVVPRGESEDPSVGGWISVPAQRAGHSLCPVPVLSGTISGRWLRGSGKRAPGPPGGKSRWGHHGDFVVFVAPKFHSPGGRDVNRYFIPPRRRACPTPAEYRAA